MTLKEEAENYLKINYPHYIDKKEALLVQEDFIAGANSKYVQIEKIKAQIEGLLLANDNPSGIFYRILELEQQLKELEQ